jgi:ligand-binding SRPBCC domain-containing protein
MGRIEIETYIQAPPSRCFDLSINVDLHVASATGTDEKIVADEHGSIARGSLKLGDTVTFEARHFGVRQRITSRITKFERPHSFRDSQLKGIFARFDHDHIFQAQANGTLVTDIFDFTCPLGPLGQIADYFVARHLRFFLIERNRILKSVAETDRFRDFLPEAN